jgi:hypothetical protein
VIVALSPRHLNIGRLPFLEMAMVLVGGQLTVVRPIATHWTFTADFSYERKELFLHSSWQLGELFID